MATTMSICIAWPIRFTETAATGLGRGVDAVWPLEANPSPRRDAWGPAGTFGAVFDLDNALAFVADEPAFWIRA
jgi:hypothetical protein